LAAISVADLLEAQKQNSDEAVKLCREAIAILATARPRYDPDIFHCYIEIGDTLMLQNDREGALKEYEAASAIARDSAASNTSNAIWQTNVATSHSKIGDALAPSSEALNSYQEALRIVTSLPDNNPRNDDLAASLKDKIQKLKP
jgi:tetratricopeptide (TPR) repeat protein